MKRIYEEERIQQGGRSFFAVKWGGAGGAEDGGSGTQACYEKEALAAGGCSFYLPTRFIEARGKVTAWYDDTEMIPLESRFRGAAERGESLLHLTAGVFRRLTEGEREAEDFLLGGDRIVYRSDCIFLHGRTGRVTMAFIPTLETRLFPARILGLARELKGEWPWGELELFVEKLEEELNAGAGGTTGLLRLFSRWERQL